MFSSTTIASSTTNPVEMVSAISVRLFRLNPHRYIAANVPISDTGTATAGISAARTSRRNRNTTKMTNATAMISVRSVSRSEARIVGVRSIITRMSIAAGIDACSTGSSALTRSTVPRMFAPGCRRTKIRIAGLPLDSAMFRTSCTESSTLATSASRTGAPLRQAMTSGWYSAATRAWSLAPTSHVWSASSIIPLGRFALVAAIAERTDSSEMPARFSAGMFISTRTAGRAPPLTST